MKFSVAHKPWKNNIKYHHNIKIIQHPASYQFKTQRKTTRKMHFPQIKESFAQIYSSKILSSNFSIPLSKTKHREFSSGTKIPT